MLLHIAQRRVAPAAAMAAAALLSQPWAEGGPRWFWSDGEGMALAGVGCALRREAEGAGRFASLAEHVRCASADLLMATDPARLPWFLGFAFDAMPASADWDGFPAALAVLPRVIVLVEESGTTVWAADERSSQAAAEADRIAAQLRAGVARLACSPDDMPARSSPAAPAVDEDADFSARLSALIDDLRGGAARKAVLATWRRRSLPIGSTWDALAGLLALGRRDPDAFRFLASPEPGRAWLGASPERLVAVRGRRYRSMALAGTRPRGAGTVPDEALAAELATGAKEAEEHALVVADIRRALEALGVSPPIPAEPALRRLASLQHLHTPIEGELPAGMGILDLVEALHPTPALAGQPREAALALIARHERIPGGRGWYGGGFGWVTAAGEGDVSVGIRAVRITGGEAMAIAGAGILAASDAASELAEIEAKLRVGLEGLRETKLPGRIG